MADFFLQGQLTDASSVARRNLARTVPGMAHFAGTGPRGTICAHCPHWQLPSTSSRKHICRKYQELMPKGPAKQVPGSTPSCRYFGGKT